MVIRPIIMVIRHIIMVIRPLCNPPMSPFVTCLHYTYISTAHYIVNQAGNMVTPFFSLYVQSTPILGLIDTLCLNILAQIYLKGPPF